MIKRHYYCHARKMHNDGSGGYSWVQFTFTHTSWFPNARDVFDIAYRAAFEGLEEKAGDRISIPTLSRL